MTRFHVAFLASTFLALLLLPPRPAWAIEEGANDPVARMEIALKGMLESGSASSFKDRYVAIYKEVAATHDLDVMTRARVGAGWSTLSADQKKALKNLLFKRVVSEYVVRLEGVDALSLTRGLASEIQGGGGLAALATKDRIVVAWRIDKSPDAKVDGEPDGTWRITDVRWGGRETMTEDLLESQRLLGAAGFEALQDAWKKKVPIPSSAKPKPKPPVEATPSKDDEATPSRSPREVVDDLQDKIIGIMKEAKTLGFNGRLERFQPLIDKTHHLPGIAQLTIRRIWPKLDDAQRRSFVEAFRRFSVARYAARFDGYSGERFVTKSEQKRGRQIVVLSDLVKSDGGIVQFNWVLRKIGGRWRILNIIVDGVSDLATKQAEYNDIYKKRGFDGLMEKLEEQIHTQETRGS